MSAVRIQSLAKIYIDHLLSIVGIEKTKIKKKRPGKANLKNHSVGHCDNRSKVLLGFLPMVNNLYSIRYYAHLYPSEILIFFL